MNKFEKGIFTISLDFELYWGMRDKKNLEDYLDNLLGVNTVVNELLDAFREYNIHTTWAIVGFLFFDDMEDLKNNLPSNQPNYRNTKLNPYIYIDENSKLDNRCHFAPLLIDRIMQYSDQEIATHTFSHYYCLESGQVKDEFYSDINQAIKITKRRTGNNVYSLVFPRNQWNKDYLSVLRELGIACYRGNPKSWIYNAVNEEGNLFRARAIRLLDAYVNISGNNTYSLQDLMSSEPLNIPSSRFLRPISNKLSIFEIVRLNRILKSMTHAAKNKQLFHLWWHPHNFGGDVSGNMIFLRKIFEHYKKLNHKYDMCSLNMKELSNLIKSAK